MATLRKPKRRACERCERKEFWDEADETWRVVESDGERHVGNPHCIHEWDINGSFSPFED